jgi:hypothetical protein
VRNHRNTYSSFIKLATRIETLLKLSGSSFTVSYLKEAHRLTMKTLAGESPLPDKTVRVAMRRGLPLIIPGDLRLLIEAKDPRIIKTVLTILSVFRVLPSYPKLKLETITEPHKGLIKTLPEMILVVQELKKLLRGNPGFNYFEQVIKPFPVVGRDLVRLTTAGPNVKLQLIGFPSDALAFKVNPVLLKWFEIFAKNTNHQDLYEKLQEDLTFIDKNPTKVLFRPNGSNFTMSD